MVQEFVRVENADGPVAEVWLSRPEKKNALSLDMLDALVEAARSLKDRPGLRAVILTGEGGDFSAGIDQALFMTMAAKIDDLKQEILTPPEGSAANRFQLPSTAWSEVPVPVIAAIDGVCFGAGAQLALGADFRIARPDTRLSIMEAKWGLIPDMGLSASLPKLLPLDRAMELIMTARVLQGAEAHQLGLVTRLSDDPLHEARQLAEALCSRSPEAVRAGKRLAAEMYRGDPDAALRLEAELQVDLIGTPNQIETVMANMQNRAPVYR